MIEFLIISLIIIFFIIISYKIGKENGREELTIEIAENKQKINRKLIKIKGKING